MATLLPTRHESRQRDWKYTALFIKIESGKVEGGESDVIKESKEEEMDIWEEEKVLSCCSPEIRCNPQHTTFLIGQLENEQLLGLACLHPCKYKFSCSSRRK